MTDRDRLAADLTAIDDKATVNPTYWATIADRLIALGWTRLDEPEDGIQGADPYSVTLASMGEFIVVEDMTPTLNHDC